MLKQGFNGDVWLDNNKGIYSISSGYKLIMGEHRQFNLCRVVWQSHALPRHVFLLWLTTRASLLILDRLNRWTVCYDSGLFGVCCSEWRAMTTFLSVCVQ